MRRPPAPSLAALAVFLTATSLLPLAAQEGDSAGAPPPIRTGQTGTGTLPGAALAFRLELWDILSFDGGENRSAGTGTAETIFRPGKNDRVRGELKLRFFPVDGAPAPVSVEKCFVRVRFGEAFVTAGKNRITWGEGRLFNAGDLLYGSLDPAADLTGEELRTETAWLTAASVPLWRGAFAEALWMPPEPDPSDGSMGPLTDSRAGGRLYWTPGRFKLEAGYLYRGAPDARPEGHHLSLSLHGVLGLDWYTAGSWIAGDNETLALSAGLYHMLVPDQDNKITLRLEAMVHPFGEWSEGDGPALAAAGKRYGLYLYPEIMWLIGESASLLISAIVNPVDGSFTVTAGGGWNLAQGLTLMLYGTGRIGEESDSLGGNSLLVSAGIRYVF